MEVLSDNTEIPYAGHPCANSVIGHSSESSVAHFIACAGKSKLVHMVFSTNGSAEHLR